LCGRSWTSSSLHAESISMRQGHTYGGKKEYPGRIPKKGTCPDGGKITSEKRQPASSKAACSKIVIEKWGVGREDSQAGWGGSAIRVEDIKEGKAGILILRTGEGGGTCEGDP